jgi:hypothetical protein
MNKITNSDLRNNINKYTLLELEANINNLQIKIVLNTQILNADFCAKYILDENRVTCEEDLWLIDVGYVLTKQPHITREELEEKMELYDR